MSPPIIGITANNANTNQTGIIRSAYLIVAVTTTVTYAPVLGTSRIYVGNVITFKGAAAAAAAPAFTRAKQLQYLRM